MQDVLNEKRSNLLHAPVFIVGGSRTGSEMLKTMLSASPELNFTNELYALCPRWLHRDLESNLYAFVPDLNAPTALGAVIELIYSKRLYGWTWQHAETELDRAMLRAELANRPLCTESILTAVLLVNSRLHGRPRQGAKFPVHYAFTHLLMDWYPNCIVIHTTRDPRAVYASQANKYVTASDSWARTRLKKLLQFFHINIQVAWSARVHRSLNSRPNYRLVRYEDVIAQPERVLKEVCTLAGIEFLPAMLEPRQYGSSFGTTVRGQRGIAPGTLETWHSQISPVTAALIKLLQSRAARVLGYPL